MGYTESIVNDQKQSEMRRTFRLHISLGIWYFSLFDVGLSRGEIYQCLGYPHGIFHRRRSELQEA